VPDVDINFDACVAKASNIVEDDCPERCPCYYKEKSNPQSEYWFVAHGLLFEYI